MRIQVLPRLFSHEALHPEGMSVQELHAPARYRDAARAVFSATHLLIAAGAGLSADSGLPVYDEIANEVCAKAPCEHTGVHKASHTVFRASSLPAGVAPSRADVRRPLPPEHAGT